MIDPSWLVTNTSLLAADIIITSIHIDEERRGKLWHVFGTIAGIDFPDWLGRAIFTYGLWALLSWIAIEGIYFQTAWALGFVIGARVSDCVISHWALWLGGYRPNPGILSTPLYVIEVALLLLVFGGAMAAAEPLNSAYGFLGGVLLFVSVLPALHLLRVISSLRLAPWKP
jgi:hypothetical protein